MNTTSRTLTTTEQAAEIRGQIEELQLWFARKPFGWRERATPGQLQQWEDREREEANLIARLELIEG